MRVVIVEDNALLREGIVALLRERSIDVVAQAEDAPGLLRIVAGHKPDVAIVDVRLPPTFTDDGVRAAIEARAPSGPGRPDPVAVRRTGLHVGAAGVGHGRRRLPAQGARGGGAGVRRGDRARRRRWHRAGPRGRRRAHAHAHRRGRRGGRAGQPHAPRARGARADGRGPHEQRDRTRARRDVGRSRSTCRASSESSACRRPTTTTAACSPCSRSCARGAEGLRALCACMSCAGRPDSERSHHRRMAVAPPAVGTRADDVDPVDDPAHRRSASGLPAFAHEPRDRERRRGAQVRERPAAPAVARLHAQLRP